MAYTTINDPSAHFQPSLFTGNGSSGNAVTNTGNANLQPDLLWIKNASAVENHNLFDSSRGTTKRLYPDLNYDEDNNNSSNFLQSFNTDGFTVGTDAAVNGNGNSVAGWQWKANGGTTASNYNGSITSTVQANTTAGFSIVTYTGVNTSNGQTSTIGHGLNSAPELIICKRRNNNYGWSVGSTTIGNFTSSNVFELNDAGAPSTTYAYEWGANPTSTVFTTGYSNRTNISGGTFIAYCFTSIQGYSKLGGYTGNGSSNGPFIYTGFKPAWFFVKRTDASGENWNIRDIKRSPFNAANANLVANDNRAQESYYATDILSNGLKLRTAESGHNHNGGTYIYMAFAENPLVGTNGVPTTAR